MLLPIGSLLTCLCVCSREINRDCFHDKVVLNTLSNLALEPSCLETDQRGSNPWLHRKWRPGPGVRCVVTGVSGHSAVKFNIYVSGHLPSRSGTATFDFKRGNAGID